MRRLQRRSQPTPVSTASPGSAPGSVPSPGTLGEAGLVGDSADGSSSGQAGAAGTIPMSMLQRNEHEELEQVNALYSLLEDRYKKRVRRIISF